MSIFVMKDIDLPDDVTSGPKTRYPFETMEIGETFFLAGRKASKFSPYAGKFGRRTKRKFQVRDIAMKPVMVNNVQTGWALAKPNEEGAVTGCAVKRLADPTAAELKDADAADAAKSEAKPETQVADPKPVDPKAPPAPAKADPKVQAGKK